MHLLRLTTACLSFHQTWSQGTNKESTTVPPDPRGDASGPGVDEVGFNTRVFIYSCRFIHRFIWIIKLVYFYRVTLTSPSCSSLRCHLGTNTKDVRQTTITVRLVNTVAVRLVGFVPCFHNILNKNQCLIELRENFYCGTRSYWKIMEYIVSLKVPRENLLFVEEQTWTRPLFPEKSVRIKMMNVRQKSFVWFHRFNRW